MNAFQRAVDYQKAMKEIQKQDATLNWKHWWRSLLKNVSLPVTHMFQQEITSAMRVGDKFGVRFNTLHTFLKDIKWRIK